MSSNFPLLFGSFIIPFGRTEARLALPTGEVGITKYYSLADADRSFVSFFMNGGFAAT